MQIERDLKKWGENSLVLVIPPDLAKYLGVKEGSNIIMQDEDGKKGRYCSFWKK